MLSCKVCLRRVRTTGGHARCWHPSSSSNAGVSIARLHRQSTSGVGLPVVLPCCTKRALLHDHHGCRWRDRPGKICQRRPGEGRRHPRPTRRNRKLSHADPEEEGKAEERRRKREPQTKNKNTKRGRRVRRFRLVDQVASICAVRRMNDVGSIAPASLVIFQLGGSFPGSSATERFVLARHARQDQCPPKATQRGRMSRRRF